MCCFVVFVLDCYSCFRANSFTLITANRVMNFIADSAEDVSGWVEGKFEFSLMKFVKEEMPG